MTIIEKITERAKKSIKSVVLPESTDKRILKAAASLAKEQIVQPVLLGEPAELEDAAKKAGVSLNGIEIVTIKEADYLSEAIDIFYERRKHKGITREDAEKEVTDPIMFAASMVNMGYVHACVAGADTATGKVVRSAILGIGMSEGINIISSTFLMITPDGTNYTFADCGVVPDPDSEQLADIAISSAKTHLQLTEEEPKVAMLSFSTKGSASHPRVEKVNQAVSIAQKKAPDLALDGELQFDAAILPEIGSRKAPNSKIAGHANVLVFPDLDSGNIGYKIAQRIGGCTALGPIIQGTKKPMHDLSRGCSAEDVELVAAIASVQAQS